MADDNQGTSSSSSVDLPPFDANEDDETRAARHELKQSSISRPPNPDRDTVHDYESLAKSKSREITPVGEKSSAQPDDHAGRPLSSPKKKRSHDQLNEDKLLESNDAASISSNDSSKDRASRLEPEKKRYRDAEVDLISSVPISSEDEPKSGATGAVTNDSVADNKQEVHSTSFATSAFGKLAAQKSAFASVGSASKLDSSDSSVKPTLSTSNSAMPGSGPIPEATAEAPKLTFGTSNHASPFAGLASGSNGFGSGFGGGGFSSVLPRGKPLSSFASNVPKPLPSDKSVKPFGAPESSSDGEYEEEEEEVDDSRQTDEVPRASSPEKDVDDKKKTRLQRGKAIRPRTNGLPTFADVVPGTVEVNDGEAGEATIASVRAKLFSLDKEAGWKERGAGMLKINVPRSSIKFDDSGAPLPRSFDASGLKKMDGSSDDTAEGHKVARLIMRQDQTHRVILNTAILPAMHFQEKASLKSVGILFTALEGEQAKPVSITIRMSAANAKHFMNEVAMIQEKLQDD